MSNATDSRSLAPPTTPGSVRARGEAGTLGGYRARSPGNSLLSILLHDVCASLSLVALLALYRLRAFGVEHVPARGPLLIVSNHQSFLDPTIIGGPLLARRHLDYVARVGLFRNGHLGGFLRAVNAIPIRQDEPDAGAIRETLRRISLGRAAVIFAEGSRTPDGLVHPFKRGVAVLVRRAACPIVPVAIEGAFDAWPRDRAVPRLLAKRVMVRFAPPIDSRDLFADGADTGMIRLARHIDDMRLDLRARLRDASRGKFPPKSSADGPSPLP